MLDGGKRVLTAFQAGNGQQNGLRDAGGRPVGGGSKAAGSYALATAGSAATLPVDATLSGLGANCGAAPASLFAGRIYSGFMIGRVFGDAEIRAGDDWVAARVLATALP